MRGTDEAASDSCRQPRPAVPHRHPLHGPGTLQAVAFQIYQHADTVCMQGKSELAHDAFQRAAETAQSDLGTDVARSYIPPRAAQELQAAGQLGQAQTMFILQAKHDQRQLAEDLLSEVRGHSTAAVKLAAAPDLQLQSVLSNVCEDSDWPPGRRQCLQRSRSAA